MHYKKIIALYLLLTVPLFSQSKYKNILISDINEPNEVIIAVNPYDNSHLVAAANLDGFYYSLDKGNSWQTRKLISSEYGVWGDPCLIFDARGWLYYFHLASNAKYWYDRIVCQKSYDGGISWDDAGSSIGNNPPHLQDKEWAACDLTYSPFRNNLYVVWTQCGQEYYNKDLASGNPDESYGSNIFFSHSTDAGLSWSNMKRINEKSGTFCTNVDSTVLGTNVCVGVNAEVLVCWAGPFGLMFDKSTDAGQTWLDNDIIATDLPAFRFNVPGIYRCFGFPSMACDQSYSSSRGTIYLSWSDQRNGKEDTDIWLIKSTNDGLTWSSPKRVNDDLTKRHQFFNWMTIDQSNGNIYVVFYDRRNYDGLETDVYLAKSTNGGESFTNERISQWSFVPDQSVFFGDYINVVASGGMVRPIWTRLEKSQLSIWTALIDE